MIDCLSRVWLVLLVAGISVAYPVGSFEYCAADCLCCETEAAEQGCCQKEEKPAQLGVCCIPLSPDMEYVYSGSGLYVPSAEVLSTLSSFDFVPESVGTRAFLVKSRALDPPPRSTRTALAIRQVWLS